MRLQDGVRVLAEAWDDRVALREAALAAVPWVASPSPKALADVTPAWLREVLGALVPGARVTDLEVIGGDAGTTSRHRLRVEWNQAGSDAGLPTRVFVKTTSQGPRNRAMVAALRMSNTEVDFYRTVRDELPFDMAPHAYATVSGRGGASCSSSRTWMHGATGRTPSRTAPIRPSPWRW